MNTKTHLYLWGRWTALALLVLLLWTHSRGEGLALPASEPVWGRKPVLTYFVLTPSLADALQKEVPLTGAEFDSVRAIAQTEADALRTLEQATTAIVQDDTLTKTEKRAQIAASGYNDAVRETLDASIQSLQTTLDEKTYTRLVTWIESRWTQERAAHGLAQQVASPSTTRTYSIFATHYDSNGSYAVALPDKCVKFADAGNSICEGSGYETGNYTVELSYEDTTTVQTFDSGPWNVDDNFWTTLADPHPRRLFTDLPLGMPAAQAAYFDDYNDGEDQFGRTVTAPFAIDLGEDVGSDIGLEPGNNDWIEVTFPWTEGWDSVNPAVVALLSPSDLEPPYTGDMCVSAWHRIFPDLEEGGQAAYLTLNVDTPAQSTNSAEWQPDLPVSGEYQVLAFVPDHDPIDWLCPPVTINGDTTDAEYTIYHANGDTTVSKNQGPMANQYLDLGTFEFDAGDGGKVTLSDLNDEENLSHTVAFSAMIFRQVVEIPPPTPTATPTSTPTPTPTPNPFAVAGLGKVNPGESLTIPVQANQIQSPGVGQVLLNVQFDPAVVDATACQPDPNGLFDTETCDPNFDDDGIFPDAVQMTLNSSGGVAGNLLLANLTFEAVGPPGSYTWLPLLLAEFLYPGGSPIPAQAFDGMICLAPCENFTYLAIVGGG